MPLSGRLRQAQEIEAQLLERLPQWRDADGRLPPETELAAEFGVSRVTVREALAALEQRGMILRKQGLGTFVNHRATHIQTRLEESIEFGGMIRASGYEAGVGFLECKEVELTEDLARRFLVQPGGKAVQISKVFTANQNPVITCTNLIPLELVADEYRGDIFSQIIPNLSIYSILHRWFGQTVVYQISDVEACNASHALVELLACEPEAALLRIEEVGYNDQQRPVFYGDAHFVPGLIKFRLVRKPIFTIE